MLHLFSSNDQIKNLTPPLPYESGFYGIGAFETQLKHTLTWERLLYGHKQQNSLAHVLQSLNISVNYFNVRKSRFFNYFME